MSVALALDNPRPARRPRVDVEALRRGVSLLHLLPPDAKPRRNGRDSYVSRCTFHEDVRPSMSVRLSPIGWTFNCFSCGERGDVIGYYMRTRKVDFRAALAELSDGRYEALSMPARRLPPLVLACDGRGCTARADVELADVPALGVFVLARWWVGYHRAYCPDCVEQRLNERRAA